MEPLPAHIVRWNTGRVESIGHEMMAYLTYYEDSDHPRLKEAILSLQAAVASAQNYLKERCNE